MQGFDDRAGVEKQASGGLPPENKVLSEFPSDFDEKFYTYAWALGRRVA